MRLLHGYVYRVAIDFKYADDLNVDINLYDPPQRSCAAIFRYTHFFMID